MQEMWGVYSSRKIQLIPSWSIIARVSISDRVKVGWTNSWPGCQPAEAPGHSWLVAAGLGLGEDQLPRCCPKSQRRKEKRKSDQNGGCRIQGHSRKPNSNKEGSTNWEEVSNRVVLWTSMWMILQARLTFFIQSTCDNLPGIKNLHLWYCTNCHLCVA